MGQHMINEIARMRTAMVTEELQFYPKIVESHYCIILDLFLHYHINAVRYAIRGLNQYSKISIHDITHDLQSQFSF